MTHDRYFLDNVAGWILELDQGKAIPFEGNYNQWLDAKAKRLQVLPNHQHFLVLCWQTFLLKPLEKAECTCCVKRTPRADRNQILIPRDDLILNFTEICDDPLKIA